MRYLLMLGLPVSVLFLLSVFVVPPAQSEEAELDGIEWLTDLDAARAQAGKEERPLLVVFR